MKTKTYEVMAGLTLLLCLLFTNVAGAAGYTLTVIHQGSGTITKNPTNATYPPGVVVTITATPNAGWYFANWSGDANGSVNPLNVTMNSDLVITGNFLAYPTYALTVVTNGQGSIVLNPSGGSYLSNSVVTATATPATGWVFAGWSGATNTSANPVTLTLNTNGSLTGTFAELPVFDAQPGDVTNVAGSTVTFFAHAVGTAPLNYQWFFSGGLLPDTDTNTTLALTNISLNVAGNYWIVATNNYGSATSYVASLTVTNATGSTNVVNSPDEASLRAAIKIGGWISLRFNGTLTITNTINITNNVILDGTGVSAVISGGNAVRLFYVANGASLTVTNLTLANGEYLVTNGTPGTSADAGAIYNNGGTVSLIGCTVTNNTAQSLIYGGVARGGAFFNNGGNLILNSDNLINNSVIAGGQNTSYMTVNQTNYGFGGAVYNTNGTVTIVGGSINGNFCQGLSANSSFAGIFTLANGLTMGGAMFQVSGNLTATNTLFTFNQASGGAGSSSPGNPYTGPASPAYGGAMAVTGGNVAIEHSQFLSNMAKGGDAGTEGDSGTGFGGAVYSAASVTAQDSSFCENTVYAGNGTIYTNGANGYGGAIYNSGMAVLNRCSIYSNYVQGGNTYTTIVTNSSGEYIGGGITGPGPNGSGFGGGIFNASQLTATNCTIGLNSGVGYLAITITTINNQHFASFIPAGSAFGGGVFNNVNGVFTAMNLTIASNLCSAVGIGIQIANTNGILRLHNTLVAGTNNNSYGLITDDGYNICSDGSANFSSGSSYNFTDPKLAPLGDYGGPTLCMALLPDSPAIDFGDSAGIPNTDQRGYVRPFGDGPDIGAYEYGSVPLAVPVLNISGTTTNMLLWFTAVPSNSYRLQASTNLTTWTDLNTNGPFASSTNISETIDPQNFNHRFFRLLMQ